jgi:hypothetical protein
MSVGLEINVMLGHRISRMVSPTLLCLVYQSLLIRSTLSDGHHFPRPYLGI